MDRKKFWESIKQYQPEKYNHIRLDHLVTVAILKLNQMKMESSFENIAVILQKHFPDKFSLLSFPDYPDSLRVDNTLRLDCKHSGLVEGSRKKGIYVLTGKGKLIAEQTHEKIEFGVGSKISSGGFTRNKYIKLVRGVTKTSGFKKFSSGNLKEMKKFDVCESLHCTINADEDHLRLNYGLLLNHVNSCKKFEEFSEISQWVLDYLEYIESNWEELMK